MVLRHMAWCLTMSQARAVGRSAPWGAGREVFGRRSVGARLCRDATLGARRWQNAREMRFPASDSGKMSPWCVPGRRSVATFRHGVFPGQSTVAVFSPHAFPKGPQAGKAPVRGNISPACIQIQLILARCACYASKKPRKAPLGNTPREHLAAKGRFRRPKPSNHARRADLAMPRPRHALGGGRTTARSQPGSVRLDIPWGRGAY